MEHVYIIVLGGFQDLFLMKTLKIIFASLLTDY